MIRGEGFSLAPGTGASDLQDPAAGVRGPPGFQLTVPGGDSCSDGTSAPRAARTYPCTAIAPCPGYTWHLGPD